MKQAAQDGLRIFVLGQFASTIPLFALRLAVLDLAPLRIANIEQLPDSLDGHDILLTELTWLCRLPAEQQDDLARRAAPAAGWITLTDNAARFDEQIAWQRRGVGHFFQKPLNPERLAGLLEDIRDRLAGAPIRAIMFGKEGGPSAYAEALRRAGVNLLTTHDPQRLLECLSEHDPEVLLLDIEMPGCRGAELVSIVRQYPSSAHLPVIFLGVVESMRGSLPARATAAECFLGKPVATELLLTNVESHAHRYRAWRRGEALGHRQQAQDRLGLDQLRQAIDEHAIVSIADAFGNITHVNDKFCAISGYTRQELLGQNHRIVKSGLHEPGFYDDLWATITSGRVWHGEVCNRRKNGDLYWVEATVFPTLDSKGEPLQYTSIRTDITALKASQKAVQNSEERLRRGQAFANIGTWDWNIETGELFWSERIASLFGYHDGELATSYENFLNAIHPDDRQAVTNAVDACVRLDLPYEIEHRVVWPDGTVRWLLERGAVTRDAHGNPLKMLGVVQDIDDRKRAELALAERERLLREAQALARIGNWSANLLTGELTWSDEIYRIFGHQPGSFVPSVAAFQAAVHPDDREKLRESERRAGKTGVHDVIHRIVCPDGAIRHVHELARVERDAAGTVVRMSGTVQDITERVEAERHTHETELRYAFAVEGAGDGVWDWDLRSGAMPLSGNYEGMLGYENGEIPATIDSWIASVCREDLPRVKAVLDEYLAGHLPAYTVDLRLRCKDGSYKWVLCRGTVVERDSEGKPVRMIGIHSDISMQKAAESALVEAREAAERANRAKSDFLSSMSHELRTPMNAIIGFAQILEYDGALTADQQDNVNEILKAGHHLLDLINEVLNLAKIESGRVDLSMEGIDLAALGEECRQLMQPITRQAGIGLDIDLAGAGAVFADRVRLKQVLLNLLSNAIKYNRPAGHVGLTASPGQPGHLRIAVTDTGPGIAAERIGELFQPFNRLGAEASEIEGSGIGLTITRRLVEMMGGAIGVESTLGVGSTFWVELAAGQIASVDADGTPSDTPAAATTGEDDATVLAIDDNPANLKLIGQIMGKRQHIRLLTAHSAELGIELALAHRPELILLDINMPGLDGYQVLELLKAQPSLKGIPLIAVTANAMPRDIERGRLAGFADYLTKPLEIDRFLDTIDRCLAEAEGR